MHLTVAMVLLIGLVGLAAARFSRRYMAGEPGERRFHRHLAVTLAAAFVMVASPNLALLLAAWIALSFGVHGLLTTYHARPTARLAARKKFVVSRLGEACAIAGAVLLYRTVGTLDLELIAARAGSVSSPWPMLLIATGALLKSVQMPAHAWLPDALDAPTPVSALLHAGVVSAGGFLLLRLSPLLATQGTAAALVAGVGALTAVYGAVTMAAQVDVKRTLAYSTIAQMGFMMLQIGCGAYVAAALHLIGHGFYKAHTFLASGGLPDAAVVPGPKRVGAEAAAWAAALAAGSIVASGLGAGARPELWLLVGMLAYLLWQLARRHGWLAAPGFALVYVALHHGTELWLGSDLGTTPDGALPVPLVAIIAAGLAGAAWWTTATQRSEFALRLRVHAYNGFYIGHAWTRVLRGIR